MRVSSSNRAFSLVEMMVVISVLAFLLAFAAPSIMSLGSTSLSAGGRDLVGFLKLARAEAIAKNTVVRVAIVRNWPSEPDAAHRTFGTMSWNEETEEFVQIGAWESLPEGLMIEPSFPSYVKDSEYAKDDPINVRASTPNKMIEVMVNGEAISATYLEFMPNGRARAPDGMAERKLAFVVIQGFEEDGEIVRVASQNWAQVNVDLLTGHIEVLRP
ncbi:MAG: prepilin-type N-terminal cleavage/methylation domain-containing protein [Verrucomicrobiota bacterium]